jgi:hypothetical protein
VSFNADFNIVMYYDPVEQIVLNTFSCWYFSVGIANKLLKQDK